MAGFSPITSRSMLLTAALALLPLSSALSTESISASETQEAFMAPVADSDLDNSRGAFAPIVFNMNSANLSASSFGNTVIGGTTGANAITNSFNGTSGLVNVIQNSGNNVIIQSSTTVNLTFSK